MNKWINYYKFNTNKLEVFEIVCRSRILSLNKKWIYLCRPFAPNICGLLLYMEHVMVVCISSLTTLSHKLQNLWSAVTFSISLYVHKGYPIHSHIQNTEFNFIGATLHRKQTIDSYNGFKCSVKIAGGLSNWFCPQQGVHQGDVMSMYFFCIYNNDLLNELVSIACPISIAHTILTCSAFADDIAVAAKSESTLQYIVDEAVKHSIKWRYSFNLDKIRILVFWGFLLWYCYITIRNQLLKQVDSHLHVGIPLCSTRKADKNFCNERITCHKKLVNMILSIDSSTDGINPISGSELYWAVAVPKLLYGCKVWSMSEQSVLMMEQAHVWAARALQSLPNHSSCLAVTASLGWLSIESHIDIKRLCYVHRLICAEPRSIARKLTVHVFMRMYIDKDISTYERPIAVLYKTCKKYNLMDIVHNELFF